jgi:ABC-type transport system involved in multi-copper enzyme maturation permease subunit
MRFTQLGGLIRYEMRLQWRQRMLTGVILSLIALPLIMYALFGQNNAAEIQRTWIAAGGIATDAALTVTTRYAVMYGAMALYVVMLLVLPVVSADVIAKDRHYGVRELVEGLPLTTGTYLAGKLLGWWAAAGSGLALALIAVGAGMWILIGPYHLAQFAGTWLAFGWGIGLINSGLSLLLAASQPTRRRAIISGVVFAALCLFANISLIGRSEPLWNLLSPGRQAISMHFMLEAWRDQVIAQIVPTADVLWALLGGVLEVVVVGTIVWAWMKRRNE